MDGRTGMTKVIVVFCNCGSAPKTCRLLQNAMIFMLFEVNTLLLAFCKSLETNKLLTLKMDSNVHESSVGPK
jgi:hypothetical protein